MTKEELAKKRGKAISSPTQNPSESLVLNTPDVAVSDKKAEKKAEKTTSGPAEESIMPEPKQAAKTAPAKKQEKTSPKQKAAYTKISLNVPDDILEYVNIASSIYHKGRVTDYINSLLKKDIEENKDKYKKFKELMP